MSFQISETAGLYSQLTGVLAGFSFTALIFLVGLRSDGKSAGSGNDGAVGNALGPAYMALLCSFISLVLTSLGYAVLAGETESAGAAATAEGVLGTGFALSAALLIYAIALTLEGVERLSDSPSLERQRVAQMIRTIIAVFVAPIATLYLVLGSGDYLESRYGNDHPVTMLEWYLWALVAVQATTAWVLYPRWLRGEVNWNDARKNRAVYRLSQCFLSITFASAVLFGIMENRADLCRTFHPVFPAIVTTVVAVAMTITTRLLAKTRPAWNRTAPSVGPRQDGG